MQVRNVVTVGARTVDWSRAGSEPAVDADRSS
jgi:hypothetical protein